MKNKKLLVESYNICTKYIEEILLENNEKKKYVSRTKLFKEMKLKITDNDPYDNNQLKKFIKYYTFQKYYFSKEMDANFHYFRNEKRNLILNLIKKNESFNKNLTKRGDKVKEHKKIFLRYLKKILLKNIENSQYYNATKIFDQFKEITLFNHPDDKDLLDKLKLPYIRKCFNEKYLQKNNWVSRDIKELILKYLSLGKCQINSDINLINLNETSINFSDNANTYNENQESFDNNYLITVDHDNHLRAKINPSSCAELSDLTKLFDVSSYLNGLENNIS